MSITIDPTVAAQHAIPPQPLGHEIFLGYPWFADYQPIIPPPQAPTVIVVEPQPPAAAIPEESRPVSPLLIEWRGDRFVRFKGEAEDRTSRASADYADANLPPREPVWRASELQPATIVFRDGHREQIREFVIASGVIYVQGNQWVDGYWSKQIPLSALDVPGTLKANSHGEFRLPSSPNEVVTRP